MPSERVDSTRASHDRPSLLTPTLYDDDGSSIHSRSDQDTDSDDDQLVQRARNSRELRAHDRILLLEDEETDRLVTDSRRDQDRHRRGSGLSVPNPFKAFGRRPSLSKASPASSQPAPPAGGSSSMRRARRKQRRRRPREDARHGEDGQLMYEMEEGVAKDDSSRANSSERDGSRDDDQYRLAIARAHARADWRRWLLIHTLIAVGFAIAILVAWKLVRSRGDRSGSRPALASNGTALFAPTTIFISLDGFRADFLQQGLTPRLDALIGQGVSPDYMLPSFPSLTFPNHHTLATGLYPEAHGIVGNTFWDPGLEAQFSYTNPDQSMDPKWWGGEPFWVTAEKQGIPTAIHMWPGSEAHILGVEPSYLDKYNGKESLDNKVSRILELLDKPGLESASAETASLRPQLIAAYVPDVDANGHRYGPNSTETRAAVERVDAMVGELLQGLDGRNLAGIVNLIVVSDHGMASTDTRRLVQLEDIVDTSRIAHIDGWPLYGIRPKEAQDLEGLHRELKEKTKENANLDVYLRDADMPERYHFSKHHRIAPLWIVPRVGWAIVRRHEFLVEEGQKKGLAFQPRGLHGYDHEHPLMRAIFVARGPAFPHPPNSRLKAFQNIEVYNILADSVGMVPKANNGTLRLPLRPVGRRGM